MFSKYKKLFPSWGTVVSGWLCIFLCICHTIHAQNYSKMSRYIREQTMAHATTVMARLQNIDIDIDSERRDAYNDAEGIHAFVQTTDENIVKNHCIHHQGDIHICYLTWKDIVALSENDKVARIESNIILHTPQMNEVADNIRADQAWKGYNLPQGFEGEGVIVGIIDAGIDFSHPTFRSLKDNRLRIVRAWDIIDSFEGQTFDKNSRFPWGRLYKGEEEILRKGHSSDCNITFHGTHTMGCAAGSGYDTPYRGIAPEADIYGICTDTNNNISLSKVPKLNNYDSTAFTCLKFSNIFAYADSVGKPAVINYSISGTPDMTDIDKLFNTYFERMTSQPGHIIVSSAGNDGKTNRYVPKGHGASAGGLLVNSSNSAYLSLSTKGKVRFSITDRYKGEESKYAINFDILPNDREKKSEQGLAWKDRWQIDSIGKLNNMTIAVYSDYNGFDSTKVAYDIALYAGKDKQIESGRYILEFEGEAEADIFLMSNSIDPATWYKKDLTGPLPNMGNTRSPACLPSIIAVGSTTHRDSWTTIDGQTYNEKVAENGLITNFSSRGPSPHGVIKPDVMAPGQIICSAMSRGFFKQKQDSEFEDRKRTERLVAYSEYEGDSYPWGIESGTSMSSPIVAGIVALWLQADPLLSQSQVMDIIAATSRHPDPTLSYPNNIYGYGEIDAYAGLLYILGLTDVKGISREIMTKAKVRPDSEENIIIDMNEPLSHPTPCRIYTTSGELIHECVLPANISRHDIPLQTSHSLIVIQIDNIGSTIIRK